MLSSPIPGFSSVVFAGVGWVVTARLDDPGSLLALSSLFVRSKKALNDRSDQYIINQTYQALLLSSSPPNPPGKAEILLSAFKSPS